MLIQKNSKKTIAISEAISTFMVFPSMYFPSLFVLREVSTSNSPQVACAHSVKAIQVCCNVIFSEFVKFIRWMRVIS